MAEFYIESRIDDFNIWGKALIALDVDDAINSLFFELPPAYRVRPISIVNRETWERHCVLTIRCPRCMRPVMECEEWMLSGITNVYRHVDCHDTIRRQVDRHGRSSTDGKPNDG